MRLARARTLTTFLADDAASATVAGLSSHSDTSATASHWSASSLNVRTCSRKSLGRVWASAYHSSSVANGGGAGCVGEPPHELHPDGRVTTGFTSGPAQYWAASPQNGCTTRPLECE